MDARIRPRTDRDRPACLELLRVLHVADGYPERWPERPADWLTPRGMLAAWVAERRGRVVGHVVLRTDVPEHGAAVWSEATGLPLDWLACVARLYTAPSARRLGLGEALLDRACDRARAEGRRPVLDVMDTSGAAIALYERRGWRRVGSARWKGGSVERWLYYYVSPDAPAA